MSKFEVKLTLDASNPEQVKSLNSLLEVLSGATPIKELKVVEPEVVKDNPKVEKKPKKETPKEETKEEETSGDFSDMKENDQLTELRSVLGDKVKNNRKEVKDKLTDLGAKNLTTLDSKKYQEMFDFLMGLE